LRPARVTISPRITPQARAQLDAAAVRLRLGPAELARAILEQAVSRDLSPEVIAWLGGSRLQT
jgi:hypothetical protein